MKGNFPILKNEFILRQVQLHKTIHHAIYSLQFQRSQPINNDLFVLIQYFTGELSIQEISEKISSVFDSPKPETNQKIKSIIDDLIKSGFVKLKNDKKKCCFFPDLKPMNGVLDYVYIRLTKKCNLNCSHCSVDATNRSKTELSETSVKKLIDELYDMMVPNISFTGGEPTLVKNLLSYVEYANQKPMRVSLLTNGFIVNQQLAKDLVKNGLKQVNISLDGACAKSHDQFRGKSGAFEKALNAIKLFKEEGIFTETTTVLHSGNSTEIEDILKLGQSIELDNMKFLPIIPFNRGEKCDYKTSFEIYKKNIKALLPFLTTSQDSENLASAKKYKHSIKCNAGTGVLSIDSNGDVLPCNNFDIMPLGNIFDRPIFDIYTNARKSKELKNALKISDTECTACPLLDDCRGGCPMVSYAYFKDFHKCDITRKLIAEEVISLRRRRYNHERL